MVKCCECGKETGDDISVCHACADIMATIGRKEVELKSVKSLSSFGAEIPGKPDLKKGAEKLIKEGE